jgi:hypothetical protein
LAAVGLALGGAFGLAGAMVPQQNLQAILWAIDACRALRPRLRIRPASLQRAD